MPILDASFQNFCWASSEETEHHGNIKSLKLKKFKLSQKSKSKMIREVCLFDKFSFGMAKLFQEEVSRIQSLSKSIEAKLDKESCILEIVRFKKQLQTIDCRYCLQNCVVDFSGSKCDTNLCAPCTMYCVLLPLKDMVEKD